ncbi:MAG: hypothetical protein Kow00109_07890 [Acidobacteriota bacterium]
MNRRLKAILLLGLLTLGLVAIQLPSPVAAHAAGMTRIFGIKEWGDTTTLSAIFTVECLVMGAVLTPLAGSICSVVALA